MRKIFTILALIFLIVSNLPQPAFSQSIDPGLFQPSRMVSLETAMKEMKSIYMGANQTRTLHCECYFDKIKQVYPNLCRQGNTTPGPAVERKIMVWMHAVPPAVFGHSLRCWKENVCVRGGKEPYGGFQCCAEISPSFKKRVADMHNLFPTVDMGQKEEAAVPDVNFGGMEEYRICRESGTLPVKPRPAVRGDIARAYFYMSLQYKFPIPDELEDQLRMWHLKDPPSPWEEERNSLIEIVQGNRNPFIDHPELVERVRDF